MRKFAVAVATTVALVGPVTVVGAAQAAEACVTGSEFRAVKTGWKMKRVQRRFDSKGKNVYQGYGYQTREWKSCKAGELVLVYFEYHEDHWDVTSKSRFTPTEGDGY